MQLRQQNTPRWASSGRAGAQGGEGGDRLHCKRCGNCPRCAEEMRERLATDEEGKSNTQACQKTETDASEMLRDKIAPRGGWSGQRAAGKAGRGLGKGCEEDAVWTAGRRGLCSRWGDARTWLVLWYIVFLLFYV